ncbi:MAG: tetratricopeptide repeat protein, partial [Cyanophyceae cyanobacterium]
MAIAPLPMAETDDNQQNIDQSHSGSGDNVAGDKTVAGDRIQQGVIGNDNTSIRIEKLEQNFEAPKLPGRTGDGTPNNLGDRGISNPRQFVGRDGALAELHRLLQQAGRAALASVAGMGGVGKTELAVQYARRHLQGDYPGGVVWLAGSRAGLELVNFARATFFPDQDFAALGDLPAQLNYCWQRWPADEKPPESVLLIFDDVTDYETQVKPFVPSNERFRILVTTREKLQGIERLDLNVLKLEDAIALLRAIAGDDRVAAELEGAEAICEWLGFLPLGIELVGYFLRKKPELSLATMLERLQRQRVEARSLNPKRFPVGLTAQRGVLAAFELSWQELEPEAQELAMRLSLFGAAPIPWKLMQLCWQEAAEEELEEWGDDELVRLHLLDRAGEGLFGLHPLVREFFRARLKEQEQAEAWRSAFAEALVSAAQPISYTMNLAQIAEVAVLIPHLKELADFDASQLPQATASACIDLDFFYRAQGLFRGAEEWGVRSLAIRESQLGADHPDTATSLNNLAELYRSQGRYSESEPLYQRSLAISESQLGADHPDTATSLNNLAVLYYNQGRLGESERYIGQAVMILLQAL